MDSAPPSVQKPVEWRQTRSSIEMDFEDVLRSYRSGNSRPTPAPAEPVVAPPRRAPSGLDDEDDDFFSLMDDLENSQAYKDKVAALTSAPAPSGATRESRSGAVPPPPVPGSIVPQPPAPPHNPSGHPPRPAELPLSAPTPRTLEGSTVRRAPPEPQRHEPARSAPPLSPPRRTSPPRITTPAAVVPARNTTPLTTPAPRPSASRYDQPSPATTPVSRRFPGPAGILPPLDPAMFSSINERSLLDQLQPRTTPLRAVAQANDFSGPAWAAMMAALDAPAGEEEYSMLGGSIGAVRRGIHGKIPHLVVMIKQIKTTDTDASAIFVDPSGEIRGTIHQRAVDLFTADEMAVGAVLVLRQVSVFAPSPRSLHLNVTPDNVVQLFTPQGQLAPQRGPARDPYAASPARTPAPPRPRSAGPSSATPASVPRTPRADGVSSPSNSVPRGPPRESHSGLTRPSSGYSAPVTPMVAPSSPSTPAAKAPPPQSAPRPAAPATASASTPAQQVPRTPAVPIQQLPRTPSTLAQPSPLPTARPPAAGAQPSQPPQPPRVATAPISQQPAVPRSASIPPPPHRPAATEVQRPALTPARPTSPPSAPASPEADPYQDEFDLLMQSIDEEALIQQASKRQRQG
eukprot:m.78105 g.78105  ORF g.78105 m.78105 type:complete len:629 (-) comp7949_c0_seq2:244-2130(-)